jgi:cytoskeleton protein RodZ
MKELGQLLKEKRENRGVTIEEVSVATKIGVRLLQAIEEGDLDKLPPKAFVRGFIQSYAKYLGLDVKEVLAKFQETVGSTNPKSIPIPEANKVESSLPGGVRRALTIFAIVLTIIAIIVIQRIISKKEAEMRSGEVQAITGDDSPLLLKASPTPKPSASPVGFQTVSEATATPAPTPTATPAQSALKSFFKPTPTPTPKPTPKPTPTPRPTPTPKPTPAETPAPSATPAVTAEAPVASTPEPNIPQEVIVEALDKVTIRVTIDNKAPQDIAMNADQIQTFKAKGKLKIYTPDGGAISVIQNGFDLGVPGNLGQPKTMVFPK